MEKKHSDIGTKLMNELMVDIIGAVIPGLLFINTSVKIYRTKKLNNGSRVTGSAI